MNVFPVNTSGWNSWFITQRLRWWCLKHPQKGHSSQTLSIHAGWFLPVILCDALFLWCFIFFPRSITVSAADLFFFPILKVFSQELSPFHMKTMSQMNVSPQGKVNIDYRFSLKPPPTPRIASRHIAWLRSEIAHAQNPRNLQQDRSWTDPEKISR